MPSLTKRFIEGLDPKAERRDRTYWDDAVRGFGVRIRPSGAMTWIVMYRNRDHRLRKYTIGPVGALTPEEARKEAKRRLGEAHAGGDPASEKTAQRKAMTVSELAGVTARSRHAPLFLLGKPGAGEANRTPDPNLGKVMLYP
jgi:Arm DNA-binding domain